jgi:abequosyltransferase
MNNDILLSICIPTYNRSGILKGSLERIYSQTHNKKLPIEILISDNCSTDKTKDVISDFIERGMDIRYIRNDTNIGMDRNFYQCYRSARGFYIVVIGDDDYLIDGKLEKLLSYLTTGEYGLVHLKTQKNQNSIEIVNDSNQMYLATSYWLTYITSNIINRKVIENYQFEKYFGTFLLVLPLYIYAIKSANKNLLVNERIFESGLSKKTNGGYNFFKVFCDEYLKIWNYFLSLGYVSEKNFFSLKKDIYINYLVPMIYKLLIIKFENKYDLNNSWKYILKNYYLNFYTYIHLLIFPVKFLIRYIKKIIIFIK